MLAEAVSYRRQKDHDLDERPLDNAGIIRSSRTRNVVMRFELFFLKTFDLVYCKHSEILLRRGYRQMSGMAQAIEPRTHRVS